MGFLLADVIPVSFLEAQQTWVLWMIFAVGLALLVWGADKTVASAVRLARVLGMSRVIVGATIVSLGTTSAETAVSVVAAIKGQADLALGNAVGSIIVDTAFIFAICLLIRRLPMDRFILERHGRLKVLAGALLTVMCLLMWLISGDINNVFLPRAVGILFLLLLVGYLYLSVRWARQHPQEAEEGELMAVHGREQVRSIVATVITLLIGLAIVVVSSDVVIGAATEVSLRYNVPASLLAVTLVAMGTSLPELATAIAAMIKRQEELAIGNVIGADILNVLFVAGAAATAAPLKVTPPFFYLYLPTMMASLILFRLYVVYGRERFHRWQGIPLLGLYGVFLVMVIRFVLR